jgi:hypothetical protein
VPDPVLWVLSPIDGKRIEEVREKIKSKMESAKLLGTFVTALLVFAGRELTGISHPPAWYRWVAGVGIVSLALGTAAYFVTMFRYDTLLMPVSFWPSPRPSKRRPSKRRLHRGFVRRPPSSAGWVLYQNMMWIWGTGFIPATCLTGLGAVAVIVALARPTGIWWLAVVLAIAASSAMTWLIWFITKPNLGVSD